MFAPDVNILLYAHRTDEKVHQAYRVWLEDLINGPEAFGLSVLVVVGFVRIATNPQVYDPPAAPALALATMEGLIERENCRLIGPGPRHWNLVSNLCRATGAKAKSVADAQHAAVAIEHGCTWVTRDGDFARFSAHGLRLKHLVLK